VIANIENWLGADKIGGETPVLPYFSTNDLTKLNTGTWVGTDCGGDPLDDLATDCETEYGVLRALYDGIDHTVLDTAGLTPINANAALFEFELLADTDMMDGLAAVFGEAGTSDTWATADDDLLADLSTLFCTDGTINTAADVKTAFEDASFDLDVTQEDLAGFVSEDWLDDTYEYADTDLADW